MTTLSKEVEAAVKTLTEYARFGASHSATHAARRIRNQDEVTEALEVVLAALRADAAPTEDTALLDWLETQVGAPDCWHDLLIQSDSEDGVWFVRVRKEEKGRRGEDGPFPLGFSPTLWQAIRAARAAGQEGHNGE